jgi:outer membrane protein TolC
MKKILIPLIAFVFGGFLTGVTAQMLTLKECIDKALEYNKSLSSAKLKLEQTSFDMKSYKANFYPQFNLMALDFYSTAKGNFTIEGGHLPIYNYLESSGTFVPDVTKNADGSYTLNQYADFPSQTMKWKLKNMFVGSVSVMEPLYSGGKISTAYEMSKLGVNMATENIRLTESEVVVKTHEAYYLAVKAKEMGEVTRSYKALLDELKKNVEGAFRHGMSTRNDIMKVQVKQNEAELSIQKADNGYQLALMNLCHIIGLPLTSEVEVVKPEVSANASLPIERGERPEHVILDNKTELARQNVKLTKSDYLPNVAVGATYSYANGGELAGKKLIDNGSASVGVVVKMPLDFFGGSTNKIRSAKAAYQIAQLEQQDLDEQMELEWAQCRHLYDEAQTELNLCQVSFEQAAENMRLSKQQYEVGFETLADYLETQAQWQQCNAALVNARCQLQLAYVRLLKASGKL